jgi:hypothetical protein
MRMGADREEVTIFLKRSEVDRQQFVTAPRFSSPVNCGLAGTQPPLSGFLYTQRTFSSVD